MFSDDYKGTYYTDQLASIQPNQVLYSVMAVEQPGELPTHIGDLVMTTKATTSYWGDKYMFFKHTDMREDVAFHPDWDTALPKHKCPFLAAKEAVANLIQ